LKEEIVTLYGRQIKILTVDPSALRSKMRWWKGIICLIRGHKWINWYPEAFRPPIFRCLRCGTWSDFERTDVVATTLAPSNLRKYWEWKIT